MHSSSISSPGLGRFLRDLDWFAGLVVDTRDPDQDAREIAAEEIRIRAPRRSGRLAGEIGPDATGVELAAPYAGPIAYGWPAHSIEANPFVETGLTAASDRAVSAYENHIGDAFDVFSRRY